MTTILHLDSSAKSEGSATRVLSAAAVAELKAKDSKAIVMYHDLTAAPLPHISPEFIGGIFGNPLHADHATVKLSDQLIEQLFAADYIVIGAPMYNFSVPSQLKAWIDYICRANKTFKYSDKGPEGLLKGKHAVIVTASGGVYSEGPMESFDHVSPYLKQVLGFIGITDITVIRAEKQAFGPEAAEAAIADAKTQLSAGLKKAA
jgi:FMN-dependent NADH-azoreductase